MVTLLATDAALAPAAEVTTSEVTTEIRRPALAGTPGRAMILVGLVLFRWLVLTGRGIAFTGRATAGLFASTFDGAATGAGARDERGRPLHLWPPKIG